MLPVNEMFETIQGEAKFTGSPAWFIRLQGCAVGCGWCDTKHTWAVDDVNRIGYADMLMKQSDAPTFALVPSALIVGTIAEGHSQHVVITGGEPCMHDLNALTSGLLRLKRTVQIETSGTSEIRADDRTWVTLSPKVGMPGGLVVRDDAIVRADEIKVPVGKPADIDRAMGVIQRRRPGVEVWLQPLSTSPKATELCIAAATYNGWRVSIQTHKFIGVR